MKAKSFFTHTQTSAKYLVNLGWQVKQQYIAIRFKNVEGKTLEIPNSSPKNLWFGSKCELSKLSMNHAFGSKLLLGLYFG